MLEDIKHYITHSIDVKAAILSNEKTLLRIYNAGQMIVDAIRKGKKLLIAGNGGSAADAMHMCTEFASRFYRTRAALPAIALSADTCAITAIGNDFGFDNVFSRQIEALGREGDVFMAISTSGNSKNILNAIDTAKQKKMRVVFLTGEMVNTAYLQKADVPLCVPCDDTPLIQEAHEMIEHIICMLVESEFEK